jgi:putative ABC transport system permease protein
VNIVALLGAFALLLLLPLLVSAFRHRTLLTMARRNIGRRRAEAMLVVGGALLGTAIITSSFVVGDVIEASFADSARTELGPIDITVTAPQRTDLHAVTAQVGAANIEGIDGLLETTTAIATLEAPERDTAVPQVRIVEYDFSSARGFGSNPQITGIADAASPSSDGILLNQSTATELDVAAGESLRLHAYGSDLDLVVSEVVEEVGLAGYGGAIVAPGIIASLHEETTLLAAPPSKQLLVSLNGGVLDTRALSDAAVVDLRAALAGLPGIEIQTPKAAVLDDAERQGAGLSQLFSTLGAFSVLAGILLLINLFVMLAEERKTELGMLRAVGFTRRRLIRAFAIEGAIYALVAAALGAVVGIGIGWLVALVAGPIFGAGDHGSRTPLVIEPVSLALGAGTGLVISLLTIWATSLRIARLNIIRAIRDLPEPKVTRARTRTLVLGSVGILVGVAASLGGYVGETAIPLLIGVPVAAFSAAPLVRRILPERLARQLVAGTVLGWGLAVNPLFPAILGNEDIIVFVAQGAVLTAGAVSLASSLDRVWTYVVNLLGRGGRGLAPRLGIAYPLARRFRTSMLLAMFSLVIFTVTILTSFAASFDRNAGAAVDEIAASYDVVLDTNPANPVDAESLASRPDVAAVAGLVRGVANFEAPNLDGIREWPITGFDASLLQGGTPGLFGRDSIYATDAEVYRAVLDDPTLVIVPENFLVAGVETAPMVPGDTFNVIEPGSGEPRELTIAGLGETDWLENGALVSREVTTVLFGAQDLVTRSYIAVADGADADAVASSLNSDFLAQGADARTFAAIGAEGQRALTGFLALLQGFLGFGLLVGIAGLGVVMVRAVRERRQEIGMLRAMGFRRGLIRTAMLSEAGLIAVQGTLIGAVLGLVTTRQLLTSSASFGDQVIPFIVPWGGLILILGLPLVASLAATIWPASRAANIRPAVALRTAD